MKKTFLSLIVRVSLIYSLILIAGCSASQQAEQSNAAFSNINLDTVQAGKYDTGKMWTFDFPPKKYFKDEYNFDATDKWLENVRMSALRFANYCSASFVSEDGLIMTNHHCARESVTKASNDSVDFHSNGFFAENLSDEKKINDLYVDQLVKIIDVTDEIQKAIDEGKTELEKASNKKKAIHNIQEKYNNETNLECSVVTFYNGGKYSLYCYKRYNDVRLVFAPETQMGFYGGDPDNFTYPRYALDCSFFRVYDDSGKPLKTEHYFKWSPNGANEGEPVFVVGNPGRTNRLLTLAQLEYQRDITNPLTLDKLERLLKVYSDVMKNDPKRQAKLEDTYFTYSNSLKAYEGIQKGLLDPVLMQKKKVFEKNFKQAVQNNPKLNAIYGNSWDIIVSTRKEFRKIGTEYSFTNYSPRASSEYFKIADELIEIAGQIKLPNEQRDEKYKEENLSKKIDELFSEDFDAKLADELLKMHFEMMIKYLGKDNPLVKNFTDGKNLDDVYAKFVKNSPLRSKEAFTALVKQGSDAIFNSSDPEVKYLIASKERTDELAKKIYELRAKETAALELLGRAFFEIYGTSIPPDATFSLRIADGIVKGYEYNGTVAPAFTTFYGLYDRYYSFNKKMPFSLPERWQKPPVGFNLETPMVFVSTNDIIGGNSGSPVINKDAEIVGLAFDGNIESLPGQFIFTTESNRTVAVHSAGMLEAIQDMYRAKRLSDELKAGKIK